MRGLLSAAIVAMLALSLASSMPAGASSLSDSGEQLSTDYLSLAMTDQTATWHTAQAPPEPVSSLNEFEEAILNSNQDDNRDLGYVFPPDERVLTDPPVSTVAELIVISDWGSGAAGEITGDEEISSCTGTFVGANVLMTAAHCVFVPLSGDDLVVGQPTARWAQDILVVPGAQGDYIPFGAEFAAAWTAHPHFVATLENPWDLPELSSDILFKRDIGLIVMSDGTLGNQTGWETLSTPSDAELSSPDFQAISIGYPGDKDPGTQWLGGQAGLTAFDDEYLYFNQFDVFHGQSGSAVVRVSDVTIVGIVSWGDERYNAAIRMNQDAISFAAAACTEVGCEISYVGDGTPDPPPPPPDPDPDPPAQPGDRPTEPAAPIDGCMYFDATQHNLCEPFLSYWQSNGGLPVFGFPTTEAFNEMNQDLGQVFLTQYFERERMEYHPDNAGTPYEILLGRLGHEVLLLQGRDWSTFPKADPSADHYYAETGHAIAPQFWEYWSNHGLEFGDPGVTDRESLALFGLPLSEPQMETNSSGDTVLTQWFERARFEFHPDSDPGLQVKLGLLGNEFLSAGTAPAPPPPPDPEPPSDGIPAEGEILYQSPVFADWPTVDGTLGATGVPREGGYSATGPAGSGLYAFNAGPYGDASYSVDMISIDNSGDVAGCLVFRATEQGAYHACVVYGDGMSQGILNYYYAISTEDEVQIIELGAYPFSTPMPATDALTVKAISQGGQLWFYVDGNLLGTAAHSAPPEGIVGVHMNCFDEVDVCGVGFFNLEVRAIER